MSRYQRCFRCGVLKPRYRLSRGVCGHCLEESGDKDYQDSGKEGGDNNGN